MKTLRQTCAATILMLVLVISIVAGEIDCPGVVSPPPPTPTSTTTTSITTTIIVAMVGLIP